ncbi:MAG: succinate dehydrogenase cytochrome b subunit [Calothrix sp. SM1_5_4]|nr:succinate dehydrogenase cytochrome b subunit [Calothrix sp. SM1_5_4]
MQIQGKKLCWMSSSIGRKQLIAVTGLGLSLFLLTHLAGNLLIFVSPQAYNEYSHALITNKLLPVAELGLVVMFLAHMGMAMRLTWSNFRARTTRYAVLPHGEKRTTWTQRSLWAQGLLILVFTILHLITFKYGSEYTVTYGQTEMRDLHRLVIEVFQEPGYVVWYVVALVVLGFHLRHGIGSSLQTLGVNHPRYNGAIRCASIGYALIVALGFISQPVYVYFIHRG